VSPSRRPWQAAAAGWAAVILVTGLLPTQTAVEAFSGGHDTAATTAGHFAAYLLLGILLGTALGGLSADWMRMFVTLALAAALGGVIEIAQAPLPYRDAQPLDFFANIAGAAVGLLLLSGATRAMRSRSHRG
jgi:VanZ family protein